MVLRVRIGGSWVLRAISAKVLTKHHPERNLTGGAGQQEILEETGIA